MASGVTSQRTSAGMMAPVADRQRELTQRVSHLLADAGLPQLSGTPHQQVSTLDRFLDVSCDARDRDHLFHSVRILTLQWQDIWFCTTEFPNDSLERFQERRRALELRATLAGLSGMNQVALARCLNSVVLLRAPGPAEREAIARAMCLSYLPQDNEIGREVLELYRILVQQILCYSSRQEEQWLSEFIPTQRDSTLDTLAYYLHDISMPVDRETTTQIQLQQARHHLAQWGEAKPEGVHLDSCYAVRCLTDMIKLLEMDPASERSCAIDPAACVMVPTAVVGRAVSEDHKGAPVAAADRVEQLKTTLRAAGFALEGSVEAQIGALEGFLQSQTKRRNYVDYAVNFLIQQWLSSAPTPPAFPYCSLDEFHEQHRRLELMATRAGLRAIYQVALANAFAGGQALHDAVGPAARVNIVLPKLLAQFTNNHTPQFYRDALELLQVLTEQLATARDTEERLLKTVGRLRSKTLDLLALVLRRHRAITIYRDAPLDRQLHEVRVHLAQERAIDPRPGLGNFGIRSLVIMNDILTHDLGAALPPSPFPELTFENPPLSLWFSAVSYHQGAV